MARSTSGPGRAQRSPSGRGRGRGPLSAVFKLNFVRPSVVGDGLAEAQARFAELPVAVPLPPAPPAPAEVRAWASADGLAVSDRGRLRPEITQAYLDAHGL